ncbi:MAG: hypothetical protein V3R51_01175, partial [Gammaproteobacteria bacterium]
VALCLLIAWPAVMPAQEAGTESTAERAVVVEAVIAGSQSEQAQQNPPNKNESEEAEDDEDDEPDCE